MRSLTTVVNTIRIHALRVLLALLVAPCVAIAQPQETTRTERVIVDQGLSTGATAALIIFLVLAVAVVVMLIMLWANGRGRRSRTSVRRY